MLTVAEYEDLVSEILTKYGYPFHSVKIKVSKRMGKSGIARNDTWKKTIVISYDWFASNGADFAVYILKHEIAHFKHANHSPAFKAECLRMGIKAKACLRPKDFYNHDWHWVEDSQLRGKDRSWVPAQYCCYKDCGALV